MLKDARNVLWQWDISVTLKFGAFSHGRCCPCGTKAKALCAGLTAIELIPDDVSIDGED